jgi:hypothetical protein
MSYELAPVVLYSQDRNRMLNFLSDVFEFEVNEADFSVSIGSISDSVSFKIENQYHDPRQTISPIEFNFRLDSVIDLKELENKFNFFIYRRNEPGLFEEMSKSEGEKEVSIVFYDIDRRPWRFFAKKV